MRSYSVVHLSHSNVGGASTASQRLHTLLQEHNFSSALAFKWKSSFSVDGNQLNHRIRSQLLSRLFERLFALPFKVLQPVQYHSLCLATDIDLTQLSSLGDIVHLHWPHASTLSIEDYTKLNKPIVITLHDCWFFCGAEHHFNQHSPAHPFNDYHLRFSFSLFRQYLLALLNAHTYRRKKLAWKRLNATFIAPSLWILQLAKQSPLLSGMNIIYCPNPIATQFFQVRPRNQSVRQLFSDPDLPILLLPVANVSDRNRPYLRALSLLLDQAERLPSLTFNILIISHSALQVSPPTNVQIFQSALSLFGDSLYNILSSCDLMFYPSLADNLPQLCIEATTQGLPIVGFNTGGVSETIPTSEHNNLVPCGNFPLLIDKTLELLSSPKLLQSQSKAALSHFDKDFNLRIFNTITSCYADSFSNYYSR